MANKDKKKKISPLEQKVRMTLVGITTFLGLNVAYIASPIIAQEYHMRKFPQIKNQKEADTLLEQERKKLGGNQIIKILLVDGNTSGSFRTEIGTYRIYLGGDRANVSALRNELYKIHDGFCDQQRKTDNSYFNAFLYLYYFEPKATMYQIGWLKP